MIPKIIHQVWLGGNVPEKVKLWSMSFKEKNPGWLRLWWNEDELRGVDISTSLHDYGNFASLSNRIRLELVERFGGIYADADVECVRPLDSFLVEKAFAGAQDKGRVCNAVFGAEPGDPWTKYQLERHRRLKSKDAAQGVYLMTEACEFTKGTFPCSVYPQKYFYPWLYDTPVEQRKIAEETYTVHHWEGSWSKRNAP